MSAKQLFMWFIWFFLLSLSLPRSLSVFFLWLSYFSENKRRVHQMTVMMILICCAIFLLPFLCLAHRSHSTHYTIRIVLLFFFYHVCYFSTFYLRPAVKFNRWRLKYSKFGSKANQTLSEKKIETKNPLNF